MGTGRAAISINDCVSIKKAQLVYITALLGGPTAWQGENGESSWLVLANISRGKILFVVRKGTV